MSWLEIVFALVPRMCAVVALSVSAMVFFTYPEEQDARICGNVVIEKLDRSEP